MHTVFIGNCQAEVLWRAFQNGPGYRNDHTSDYIRSYVEADAAVAKRLAVADVIAMQVTDRDQKVTFHGAPTTARIVQFPMLTAFFLWPYFDGCTMGQKHPRRLCQAIPKLLRRQMAGQRNRRQPP